MTTPKQKREWTCVTMIRTATALNQHTYEFDPPLFAVIEHGAYEQAIKERDELAKRLREYEHECETVNEMRKERDDARAEVERLRRDCDQLARQPNHAELEALLTAATAALERIAGQRTSNATKSLFEAGREARETLEQIKRGRG